MVVKIEDVIGVCIALGMTGVLLYFVYQETGWATTTLLGLIQLGTMIRSAKERK